MIREASITVATVTYGNRWQYLEKVVERIINMPEVRNMVIIDNGATYDLKEKVHDTFNLKKDIVIVVNQKVGGSAEGFYQAIKNSRTMSGEYLMILDDDNLPEKDIFKNLNCDYKNVNSSDKDVIAFYRDRYFKDIFDKNLSYSKGRFENSYCKFSIKNKIFKNRCAIKLVDSNFSKVIYSQYSGLLLRKEILDVVGYPNRDYFLYVDDTDFTYRLTQSGYTVLAYKNGKINDLEKSWSQVENEKEVDPHKMIFKQDNPNRGLYYIRNRVYFELNNLVTNKFLYNLNRVIYYMAIFIKYMPKNRHGLSIFSQMIKMNIDAQKGILGKLPKQ